MFMPLAISDTVTIIVEAAPPPPPPPPTYSITLTVDKTSGRVGDTFRFSGSVTAPYGRYEVWVVDATEKVLGRIDVGVMTGGVPVSYAVNWVADEAGTFIVHAEMVESWLPPWIPI